MNSKKKSTGLLKCIALLPLNRSPTVIWITPNTTAIFILKELRNTKLFDAWYHFGSIPKIYRCSWVSWSFPVSCSQPLLPNKLSGTLIKSLYINPLYVLHSPISSSMYLADPIPSKALTFPCARHNTDAKVNSSKPWPTSPNIMPNKNGNVKHVNSPGLASL